MIIYNGIVEKKPLISNRFNNLSRLFRTDAFKKNEWDDSQENLKNLLIEHIGFLNNNNIEYYMEERYRLVYLYDDFDNDGKKEMFASILTSDKREEMLQAASVIGGNIARVIYEVCCIDEDGISTVCLVNSCEGDTSIKARSFGKTQLCMSFDKYFEMCDKEVIVGSYWINGGIDELNTVKIEYEGGYNEDEEAYDVDYLYAAAGGHMFSEKASFWYIDHHFVECASKEINTDQFYKYEGADQIVKDLDCYAELSESYYRSELLDGEHYSLYSILLCSDGMIYLNCMPPHEMILRDGDIMIAAVICLRIDGDKVIYESSHNGWRLDRLTDFTPYYPVIDQ